MLQIFPTRKTAAMKLTRHWWFCHQKVRFWNAKGSRIPFQKYIWLYVNSRIDDVIKDLTELKSNLQFSQKEIDDLRPLTEQMVKVEKEIWEVQAQVDYHCDKIEYFENQSCRNNISIEGIPEKPDKTWEETECGAKVALESKLNLSFEVQIERAHRTGWDSRRQPDDFL